MDTNLSNADLPRVFEVTRIITFFKVRLEKEYPFPFEKYRQWMLFFVESGTCSLRINDAEYQLEEGSIFFLEPGQSCQWGSGPVDCVMCETAFSVSSEHMDFFSGKVFPPTEKTKKLAEDLFQNGAKLFYWNEGICCGSGMSMFPDTKHTDLFEIKLRMQLLLTTLYAKYSKEEIQQSLKKQASDQDTVHLAVIYMKKHLSSMLYIQDIADALGISPSTLKKAFSDKCGCSVMQYFTNLKIKQAKSLLQNGMGVNETADALGFSSPSYFSRWFKKETGTAPTQYKG